MRRDTAGCASLPLLTLGGADLFAQYLLYLLGEARYVARDEHCAREPLPRLSEQFIHEANRGNVELWIRKGTGLTETREPP